jgi:hypothetical protein
VEFHVSGFGLVSLLLFASCYTHRILQPNVEGGEFAGDVSCFLVVTVVKDVHEEPRSRTMIF